jgi:hypothetical protein
MSRADRISLIKKIEAQRHSRVIVYITGDRPGLETKIATDIFPLFHKHLMDIGDQERLDLFIYSNGGLTNAGYGLVNLFRQFCEKFNVIIPFKALSCATLISLGADEIVMTKLAQLGPIDPSLEHPLGPKIDLPGQPPRIMQISVEDVHAFLQLAKESDLRDETSMRLVFQILASSVHPLALGSVKRSKEQIGFLANELMSHHYTDKEHVKKVVKDLVTGRFSHDYIIGRKEAKETLHLNVIEPDIALTKDIVDLFMEYNKLLLLDTPYNIEAELGKNDKVEVKLNRGIIESEKFTHVFRTVREVRRIQTPQPGLPSPVFVYQERPLNESWIEDGI